MTIVEEKGMLKPTLSVNRKAVNLVNTLIDQADTFGVLVRKTTSGATVIDAGIDARGGFAAGQVITENLSRRLRQSRNHLQTVWRP